MAKSRQNPTKGWAKASPSAGKERHRMFKKCGSSCFLLPNKKTPGASKFPVCAKNSCKKNCKGILAAYVRAREYRKKTPSYNKVAKKANNLYKSHKCTIVKSRRRHSRKRSRKSKRRSRRRKSKRRSRRRRAKHSKSRGHHAKHHKSRRRKSKQRSKRRKSRRRSRMR